jgi:hypothetical protein
MDKDHTTWATPTEKAARDLLYALSHREDITYHVRWYTSHGTLVGMGKTQW